MSDKMDDERMEMNEKLLKIESRAAETEKNLQQQVRNDCLKLCYLTRVFRYIIKTN